jgi:hypothetical protein
MGKSLDEPINFGNKALDVAIVSVREYGSCAFMKKQIDVIVERLKMAAEAHDHEVWETCYWIHLHKWRLPPKPDEKDPRRHYYEGEISNAQTHWKALTLGKAICRDDALNLSDQTIGWDVPGTIS